ncbi:doublecortin domain-containing protein 2B isoform X4 [Cygnus olor]|uniref:doublecortin domain-containing protein 2B isoform X4 n=1 Tax=Cygnus olor TaxID=8869 RepID=UPI001ADE64E8|nr:doublecortin domain-containing protein 2B isoform X4 [Cygnus olor]
MSSRGLALAPPAKNVVVYRNGDPFFHGKKFVVNQRRFLTFEAFLKEVTRSIHAPLAVRNLYTPRHGHRIAELVDLQDGYQYVAAGFEKFKRLNYLNQGRKELRGTSNSSGVQSHTVAPWKSNIATRRQKHTHLTIHVFRNGDLLSPPFRLLFSQSAPLQWDTLLAMLTVKADLRSGAVNRLCRLDGTQVFGEEELVNDGYYVAVGTEEYKKLPYFELLVPQDSACRTPRLASVMPPPRTVLLPLLLLNHPNSCRVQTPGAAETDRSPVAFPPLHRQVRRSHLREEEPIFHAKPVRAGQNRRSYRSVQHWPHQEESVYKAKDPRKEMQGAWGVREHEHTRVEAPTDQARAAGTAQKPAAGKRDGSASEGEDR